MRARQPQYLRNLAALFFILAIVGSLSSLGYAASVTLTWQDNSINEDGFKIERAANAGTYAEIASVAPNTQSYTDSGVVAGTSYCFRIRSFNTSGASSPSNESCVTIPLTTFTLNLTKSGTGSGSVTSAPAGISCGTDCSEVYSSGTVVSLMCIREHLGQDGTGSRKLNLDEPRLFNWRDGDKTEIPINE